MIDLVRVAEDYATLDHLSGGRLEIIIGNGHDPNNANVRKRVHGSTLLRIFSSLLHIRLVYLQ